MPQPVILHVEDDPDDAFFVAHAFATDLPGCVLKRVTDGSEAIDYLGGTGEFATPGSHPRPELVLLDLKLPDVDGFEVLQWIRSQAQFKDLHVAILSGSSLMEDMERARRLGANAYFVKSPKYADVVEFAAELLRNQEPGTSAGGVSGTPRRPKLDSTTDSQVSS